jgi:DNA-binding NarL/FixJ family response regulator
LVCVASDGEEVIDWFKQNKHKTKVDVVIMDIQMPIMDGLTAVKLINKSHPEIKIVALSVSAEMKVIRDMIQAGAHAYLYKDSSPDFVKTVLDQVHQKGFYYDKIVVESLLQPENQKKENSSEKEKNIALIATLSQGEIEFIKLSCSELTYKEIADEMCVSQRTVDGYRESVFVKLDIRSRTGIVLFAVNTGLYILK